MRNMRSSRPHCRTRARRCCKDTCNTFDSGPIAPGQSWKTTIRSAGTFGYHCTQHPNMTATLLVQSVSEKSNQGIVEAPSHPRAGAVSLRWVPPTSPEQFHPILVNFTAALLPLALLSEILGRVFRRRSLHDAALWMVVFAAANTPLTVAAGWWWRHTVGANLPQKLITIHQWLGTSAAALFIILRSGVGESRKVTFRQFQRTWHRCLFWCWR